MTIVFFEPLSRALERMKDILFRPFDLPKWFVLGFSAFLANLMNGNVGGGGGSHLHKNIANGNGKPDTFLNFPFTAWEWLQQHPGWIMLIIGAIIFFIALLIVLTWISSRGTFMFLDNVVHNKAEIAKPWRQFKHHGNSLFLWRLGYGFVCFVIFAGAIALVFIRALELRHGAFFDVFPVSSILSIAGGFIFGVLGALFISMLVENFVVPIMYIDNISILPAWSKFLDIFTRYFFQFLLYGILLMFLYIIVIVLVMLIGVFTCCIGFVLIAFPYISSVVMLPVSVTFRAFSLEFLKQFGEAYHIFPPNVAVEEVDHAE